MHCSNKSIVDTNNENVPNIKKTLNTKPFAYIGTNIRKTAGYL